jgi:methyltransferase
MVIFWILLGVIACERVAELVVSARHAKALLGRGGVEYGFGHFPVMIVLHVGLIAGCVLEPLLAGRTFLPALGFPMLALTVLANVLRWWCITTLGERWTARVIVLPRAPLVRSGPYRWFAHPNYVAVVVEGFALPLTGSAWITAAAFTVLNAALLTVRIRCEVGALAAAAPGGGQPPAMRIPGTAASWPAGDAMPGGSATPDAGAAGTGAPDSAGIA